jgi:hypothetical protein
MHWIIRCIGCLDALILRLAGQLPINVFVPNTSSCLACCNVVHIVLVGGCVRQTDCSSMCVYWFHSFACSLSEVEFHAVDHASAQHLEQPMLLIQQGTQSSTQYIVPDGCDLFRPAN